MNNKEPVQLSINCAKCGATNKFMSDNIPMFCSFCGATLPDMSKHIDEAISMQRERERHEMAKEKTELEIKKEYAKVDAEKKLFRDRIIRAIIMLVFGALAFLALELFMKPHH